MILFFNVLITPQGLKHHYDRTGFRSYDNFDIFKYSISTIAPIYKWSQVIIQIKLDDAYKSREQELKNHIESLFPNRPNFKLVIDQRNESQKDWIKSLDEFVDDNLIFFSCNHDHVFIDNQIEYFNQCIEKFKETSILPSMFALSHYPDYIPLSRQGFFTKNDSFFTTDTKECASFVVITKSLYRKWWCEVDFGDAYLPRPDWEGQLVGKNVDWMKFSVPFREIFRHFDGYHNVVNPTSYHMKYFPPLEIPHNYTPNLSKISDALSFYLGRDTKEFELFYAKNKEWISRI